MTEERYYVPLLSCLLFCPLLPDPAGDACLFAGPLIVPLEAAHLRLITAGLCCLSCVFHLVCSLCLNSCNAAVVMCKQKVMGTVADYTLSSNTPAEATESVPLQVGFARVLTGT